MPAEVFLQFDLFTGELVDNRTDSQKRRDEVLALPQQMLMFSQSTIARIDVNPHPKLKWEGAVTVEPLTLEREDTRTEEEKEADRERAAREHTPPLFADDTSSMQPPDIIAEIGQDDDEVESDDIHLPIGDVTQEDLQTAARAELERVVTDISQTIAATPDVLRAQSVWLALATLDAHTSGIPTEEVKGILGRLDGAQKPREYKAIPVRRPTAPSNGNFAPATAPSRFVPYLPPSLI